MDNATIKNQAVKMLNDMDVTNAESVQINNVKYEDGTSSFEVSVSFPAKKEITASTDMEAVRNAFENLSDKEVREGIKDFNRFVEASISGPDYGGPIGSPIPTGDKGKVVNVEDFNTKQLYEELLKREGVEGVEVGPHDKVNLTVDNGVSAKFTGPCRIITNFD